MACAGAAFAGVSFGPVFGFDPEAPHTNGLMLGGNFVLAYNAFRLNARAAFMPTDKNPPGSGGPNYSTWEQNNASAYLMSSYAPARTGLTRLIALSYRFGRSAYDDYTGSSRWEYWSEDAITFRHRVLAGAGLRYVQEGKIEALSWLGVGPSFLRRRGYSWHLPPPPATESIEESLDEEWTRLEAAAAAGVNHSLTHWLSLTLDIDVRVKIATVHGDDRGSIPAFSFALFVGPSFDI